MTRKRCPFLRIPAIVPPFWEIGDRCSARILLEGFLVASVLGAAFFGGCGRFGGEAARLADYRYRVENTTKQSAAAPAEPVARVALPDRMALRLEVEEQRAGVFGALPLRRCGLDELIGERNSSMGRTMADSQRLLYELEFIHLARLCSKGLALGEAVDVPGKKGDAELLLQLQSLLESKVKTLAALTWNVGLGGDELRSHLSTAAGRRVAFDEVQAGLELSARSLVQLAQWNRKITENFLENPGSATDREELLADLQNRLEDVLQNLGSNASGGALLLRSAQLTQTLEAVSASLDARLKSRPSLCSDEGASQEAEVLKTIFETFYVGGIQPELSEIDRWARNWSAAFQELLEASQNGLSVLELEPGDGLQVVLASRADFMASVQTHSGAWQEVLGPCGWMPQ